MSFGFCIKKREFSSKETLSKNKLNFFSQTFKNVNILDPEQAVSTVKENATRLRPSKAHLFDPLEEAIIVRRAPV